MKDVPIKFVVIAILLVAALQIFKSFLRENWGGYEYVWTSAFWVILTFSLYALFMWLKDNHKKKKDSTERNITNQ